LVIRSAVFMSLAIGGLQFLLPEVIGKAWMMLLSISVLS
jgi:hypothetical protein